MMKKRILALLMTGAMVMSLAACGSSSEKSEESARADSESAEAETEETDAESAGDISFTVQAWNDNVFLMERAVEIYNEAHGTNHTVEISEVDTGTLETTQIACGEGGDYSTLPDVLLMQDASVAKFVSKYPDMYVELTDLIDYENLADLKVNLGSYNGAKYGIPVDSAAVVGLWDVDALAAAGYTLEDLEGITWDRLVEIGADYYAKTGSYLLVDDVHTLCHIISLAEGGVFNEDGSYNIEGNEVLYQIGDLIKELRDNNVIYFYSDWNDYVTAIGSGKAAGCYQAVWMLVCLKDFEENRGKIELTSLPSFSGDPVVSVQGGSSFLITANAENPDIIAEILNYSFAGEGMELLAEDFVSAGYLPTYLPLMEEGYFDEIDDGFFPKGVWADAAEAANNVPDFSSSPVFSTVLDSLCTEFTNIYLEDLDVESSIDELQSTLDFELQ